MVDFGVDCEQFAVVGFVVDVLSVAGELSVVVEGVAGPEVGRVAV